MKNSPGKVLPRAIALAVLITFGATPACQAQSTANQLAVWGGGTLAGSLTNVPAGLTNLIAIAAGEYHLLALKGDGTVAAWGYVASSRPLPPYGVWQLNDLATNVPADLNGVVAIAAGSFHNLVLRSNGTVTAWGDNSYGQTNVPAGLSNVVAVAAGDLQSLALKADGRVVAWGAAGTFFPPYYSYSTLTNVPPGLSNVVAIAAGCDHNLALRNDGKVIAWGLASATNVPGILSNVIAIACGGIMTSHTSTTFDLALRTDGTVVSWVTGAYAQPDYPWLASPRPPTGLSNVVAIAAGGLGMALKADGSMALWGLTNLPPPIASSNIISIAAGHDFAAAMAGDGSPSFTVQPFGQSVTRGSEVQFHARATGVQPLSYQWQLEGVNLPGATNASLTLTNIQGSDVGEYRVIASNALATVTSTKAALRIPFSTDLATALNGTNLFWTTSPTNAPWFAQIQETHDGDVAAQSGPITHNQQSLLQASVTGPGTLTFWWKVSSEEGYDRLWFNMDAQNWGTSIHGETDWQQITFHVPPGSHVLNWAYTKDGTVSAGRDAGWVDEVVFTPALPLVLSTPRVLADGSFGFVSEAVAGGGVPLPSPAFITIQASTNLRDWVPLLNSEVWTNGVLFFRDPAGTNFPQRFYRAVQN